MLKSMLMVLVKHWLCNYPCWYLKTDDIALPIRPFSNVWILRSCEKRTSHKVCYPGWLRRCLKVCCLDYFGWLDSHIMLVLGPVQPIAQRTLCSPALPGPPGFFWQAGILVERDHFDTLNCYEHYCLHCCCLNLALFLNKAAHFNSFPVFVLRLLHKRLYANAWV